MKQFEVLNKALDKIRENDGMYSFSGCHYANNLKLTDDGNVEITISVPAKQLGCSDVRELNANHASYENLEMLPVFVFVDPKEFMSK